jgi:hypothetical protein
MPWDVSVELENRPGTIADMGEATGRAGLNLLGVCGFPCEGVGVGHLLTDDAEALRACLESAGVTVSGVREVLVTPIEDRPGALGTLARRMADADINVDLLYLAMDNRVVMGVDDLDAARALL